MSDSLGEAFIQFSSKGYEGLTGQLKNAAGAVSAFTKNAAEQFSKLANASQGVFATLTGSILGSVAAASPAAFEVYTGSFKVLAAVVGTMLIPVIRDLTTWTLTVAQYISNLDDDTKKTIATAVEWGIAITGIAVAVNTLGSVFGGLGATIAKVIISNPLLAVLSLIAVAVFELIGRFDGLKGILNSLGSVFSDLFGGVSEMIKNVIASFKAFGEVFASIFPKMGEYATAAFDAIGKSIKWVIDGISTFIGWIEKLVIAVGVIIEKASNWEFTGYSDAISEKWDEFDKKVEQKKQEKLKAPSPNSDARKAADNSINQALQSGFMGSAKGISMSGISSSWASVQSSFAMKPELKLAEESKILQQQTRDLTKQIADNTSGKNNVRELAYGGGSDY